MDELVGSPNGSLFREREFCVQTQEITIEPKRHNNNTRMERVPWSSIPMSSLCLLSIVMHRYLAVLVVVLVVQPKSSHLVHSTRQPASAVYTWKRILNLIAHGRTMNAHFSCSPLLAHFHPLAIMPAHLASIRCRSYMITWDFITQQWFCLPICIFLLLAVCRCLFSWSCALLLLPNMPK